MNIINDSQQMFIESLNLFVKISLLSFFHEICKFGWLPQNFKYTYIHVKYLT